MASLGKSAAQTNVHDNQQAPATLTGTLGDFRIVCELGRGGMGVVYEAEQLSLGRRVAIKVLPFAALLDPRQLQRFKNESQAAAMLKHPNIVGVHAVGFDRGMHFYAMELVRGQSLAEVIAELDRRQTDGTQEVKGSKSAGPQGRSAHSQRVETRRNRDHDTSPVDAISSGAGFGSKNYYRNVAQLGITLSEALQYAHEHGVIHRDIKPSNLLLNDRGEVCIADFGLARFQENHELTMTGELLGTLRYMSPEQASGHRVLDHRTDIYSLGLVLYELMTLRPAFGEKNRKLLLQRIVENSPQPPQRLQPNVPRDFETVILKAVSKDPDARYASACEMADDLRRFTTHRPVLARRASRFEHVRRWVFHNPWLATTTAATIVLLIALGIGGPISAIQQRERRALKWHGTMPRVSTRLMTPGKAVIREARSSK